MDKTYEVFEGVSCPKFLHTQESLRAATKFQFQDTDILLVTFPKSGTTWMQQILSLIINRGDLQNNHSIPTWNQVPWIEQSSFSRILAEKMSRPHLFTTHLPARLLISNLKKSKVRVVYMARNPKDVLVSFYHFHKFANFLPHFDSFDDFFDQFLAGTVSFGSWFTHIKEWLDIREEINFLLITYEELSQEPHQTLQKLCKFLGQSLEPKEVEDILKYSSFSFMSQNDQLNYRCIPPGIFDFSSGKFMRKGVTENWMEHFSPEQNVRFNNVYKAEMGNITIKFPWTMD